MKISGLIIAAGLSGRMNSFKPILKIKDQTIIQIIAKKLLHICDNVVIITGYNSNLIEGIFEASNRLKLVYNENYTKGMFTSLKRGINELLNSDWIIYHFVDQPLLPSNFYNEFVDQIDEEYNWIQPAYNSTKGHPILLAKPIYQTILRESDESSLKLVSNNHHVKKLIWDCKYPQILDDLDTPEEFEKLLLREESKL